ncbi:MAG: SDR family NAD(P)-dependent oxidoreductase [Blastochloris sp.]|nr:SDR family NAD(P)-dependent oxidoreductase [Blastochloris sp.]
MTARIIFVTGAARGLGKAIVERFLKEGYYVLAFDWNADNLNAAYAEWNSDDCVIAHVGDVRQRESVQQAVEASCARWGRIDVLANVAGVALEEIS